jgi:hypothetical protein
MGSVSSRQRIPNQLGVSEAMIGHINEVDTATLY